MKESDKGTAMRMTKRRWGAGALLLAVIVVAVALLMPKAVDVEVARVSRGPLEVSLAEDGVTRIRERYEVAAPVNGQLLRVEVHPGDIVTAGTALARMAPSPLDPKQRTQLEARLESARRGAREAEALLRRSREAAHRAQQEAQRIRQLASESIVSRDALDAVTTAASVAQKEQEAALFRSQAASYDVIVAEAALGNLGSKGEVVLRSPVAGRVLQVLHESETVVPAGTPLIVVGDPASLEVVADFLSTDAVRIRPGAVARVERWGGPRPLEARVRLVEPAAFMKISALGVEEQRVNVICDLTNPPRELGDQYRVDVRVILRREDALKAPATALFTMAGEWKVFAVRDGRAALRTVTAGDMSETEVEIRQGLQPGEAIVVHPSDQIRDGVRVVERR